MKVFQALFSFEGRLSRSQYFWGDLVFVVFTVVVIAALSAVAEKDHCTITGIAICSWSWLALRVKRLHDLDRSGWFVALLMIPLVNVILAICLVLEAGMAGPNRFGEDPKAHGTVAVSTVSSNQE